MIDKNAMDVRQESAEHTSTVECGNGLAANGGPIPIPCGGTAYVDWDRPSREIMKTMVENPEFYMRGLSPRDRKRMEGDLMDMAKQLGMEGRMKERMHKMRR
ncbi:hypothetical protein [Alkalilimnicola sp. S0819]|uniref:hypothetical protein n=1 Tax=Alkalilimnicola sp. S0819 TaxID=2613922 RepID=UPI001261991E|nr:hypothetical protein [Alkalilimnicola sp. S0819]KAB7627788.1 hypothetical protein F3N43_02090 [Alkalilimnicola sp. S0819]MPQ15418.1 hypothetical protein [Alkalilimnicola sp. S0819]